MWSKRHNSIRVYWNPFIPAIIPTVRVHVYIFSILIDDLALYPLSRGVSDIDPFSNFHFSSVHFKRDYVLHKVCVEALNKLIDCMFVLGENFQRFVFFESESIDSFLELPVLFSLIVLSVVVVSLIDFGPFEGWFIGLFWGYFVCDKLDDVSLFNAVVIKCLFWV